MERLQKILSQAGVASRRAAERFIEEGRVREDVSAAPFGGAAVDTRGAVVEDLIVNENPSLVRLHKASDDIERQSLARAARAEEHAPGAETSDDALWRPARWDP